VYAIWRSNFTQPSGFGKSRPVVDGRGRRPSGTQFVGHSRTVKEPSRNLSAAECEKIARKGFAEIASRFPNLRMTEDQGKPVEISITLPVQPGLRQRVWLCLQNKDELHFQVGHFWLEWFPCSNPSKVQNYVESVSGYLSGQYRVIEHYRGRMCVRATLEAPTESGWKTVGTYSRAFWSLIPWKESLVELSNSP
jgi:hypothetical protein